MATTNIKKNSQGYGYKYTDLAEIHTYLEGINATYYQYIERLDNEDYIYTVPIIDGEEKPARRGCRVVQATLNGKSNPCQEQGSALTYARRYSLLMAFGLATTDDDAQCMTVTETKPAKTNEDVLKQARNYVKMRSAEYQKGVLDHYGISCLADMTKEQAEDFINSIKNKENK